MQVELSDRDLAVIRDALHENADALEGYVRWINDRPMLPEREKAIATVKADVKEAHSLWMRLCEPPVLSPVPRPLETKDEEDPYSDERWQVGCDFALGQLCEYLDVDPALICWDAATETVDGDVKSVIGNIMRAKFDEEWSPRASSEPAVGVADKEGWKLVPIEPTEEMIAAGWIDKEDVSPREIYWAMLSAAPTDGDAEVLASAQRERDDWKDAYTAEAVHRLAANERIEGLEARVAELEAGLRPLSDEFQKRSCISPGPDIDHWPIGGSDLTYGDLRRARALLSGGSDASS